MDWPLFGRFFLAVQDEIVDNVTADCKFFFLAFLVQSVIRDNLGFKGVNGVLDVLGPFGPAWFEVSRADIHVQRDPIRTFDEWFDE